MTKSVDNQWNTIKINNNNIEYISNKSFLIKMPSNSEFAGYKFWASCKLINEYDNYITLSYKDDFEFRIFKQDKNKKIIDEDCINANQLEEIFECMNNCCREKDDSSYLIINEPKKINIEVKIDEELLNE